MTADQQSAISGWVVGFVGVALGVVSFLCSRGQDGELFGALVGFGVLACVYSAIVLDRAFLPAVFGLHFILFELCIVAGMLIFPGLEEMGGMLYLILPLLGLMVVLTGAAARFVAGRLTKRRTESPVDRSS